MLESKLMQTAWEFTRGKLPPILQEPEIELWLKRCYYVGANHVLSQIMDGADMDESDDLSASDHDKVGAILREITDFLMEDVDAYDQQQTRQ